MRSRKTLAIGVAVLAGIGAAGCGGSSSGSGSASKPVNPNKAEVSPAGDIPDSQAFVAYSPPGGGYSVKVPEGWARKSSGAATVFTDKLNSVTMQTQPAKAALTPGEAKRTELPRLSRSVKGFSNAKVSSVARTAGPAVRITYLASGAPGPVTGKSSTRAVERYVFFHKGKDVVLTLEGAKGADNVDPWKIVTDSLRYTG